MKNPDGTTNEVRNELETTEVEDPAVAKAMAGKQESAGSGWLKIPVYRFSDRRIYRYGFAR
ncbi:MAG: hypothetical protein MUC65_01670 [Pontiellaceae bacterium]|nr:hypothetical protein [Pontiellaceae bacterium]